MTRLAYPYLRFSDPKQSQGDSTRRQGDWFADTCAREGWQIDTSFPLADRGKSAYHGDHLKADLGRFLAAVTSGRIPRGSVLLCEELDRLDRREKKKALPFVIGLLTAGIDIRTRDRHYTEDSIDDLGSLLDIIIRQGTANEESRKKSVRIAALWHKWKERIAAGEKVPPPGRLPPWVRWHGGRFELVPGPAVAVQLIFRLAGDGLGVRGVVARLNGQGGRPVPTIGRCPTWRLSYIAKLLGWRAVLGEFEDGAGTAHPGLFPAVVTEAEFHRARLALEGRRIGTKGVGRAGAGVNVFAGLLVNALDGSRLYVVRKAGRRGDARCYLVGSDALRKQPGGVRAVFPYAVFEAAVLKKLREIDPRKILGQPAEADEVMVLASELKSVESSIVAITADLDTNGDSPVLFRRLRRQESRQKELAAALALARSRAAHPMSERWGECQAALDAAPDKAEARLRLRTALAQVVESIHCLFVPRAHGEVLAAVQFWFKEARAGERRDYLIDYRANFNSGAYRRPPRTEVYSFADKAAGPIDLRKAGDVKKILRVLNG